MSQKLQPCRVYTLVGRSVLLLGSVIACGCEVVHGSGRVVEQDRDISRFERIILRGEGDIDFQQAERTELVIEAEDNIVPELVTKVEGRNLIIDTRGDVILDPTRPIIYHLAGPVLEGIAIEGSGNFDVVAVESESLGVEISGSGNGHFERLKVRDVELAISGSGALQVEDLSADAVAIRIEGDGEVTLAGQAQAQSVAITGSGNYFGFDCDTELTSVQVSGSGNADVAVRDSLKVDISGSGDVHFAGSPELDISVTGSGSVSKR